MSENSTPKPTRRVDLKRSNPRPWGLVALVTCMVLVVAAVGGLWGMRSASASSPVKETHDGCQVLNKRTEDGATDAAHRYVVSTTCGDYGIAEARSQEQQADTYNQLIVGLIYNLTTEGDQKFQAITQFQRKY